MQLFKQLKLESGVLFCFLIQDDQDLFISLQLLRSIFFIFRPLNVNHLLSKEDVSVALLQRNILLQMHLGMLT